MKSAARRARERAGEHVRAGRLADAAACYRAVLRDEPGDVQSATELADVLEAMGEVEAARRMLEEADRSAPGSAVLLERLGDARQAGGDPRAAIEAYDRALDRDGSRTGALWGIGCALAAIGEFAAASEGLRRLVDQQPEHGLAWNNLGQCLFQLGQVDPAIEAFCKAKAHLPEVSRDLPLGNIAVIIPGSPRADNRAVLEARRAWSRRCLPDPVAAPLGPIAEAPRAIGSQLRVGYVSAFLADRNWMKPVWGLINHHDRERFQIHLFSDSLGSRTLHGYREDERDRFHEVNGLANPDLARLIREERIDVLVDLNGYSFTPRLGLYPLRPAPVQLAWFNMFATSGMDGLDVLVGDRHVIPPAEEAFYTERVFRLSGSYLPFEIGYPVPNVVPPPCLERGRLTFGCLAPQYKITTEVVETWARILKGCPGSSLLLKNKLLGKPSNRDFVAGLFAGFGIEADRLRLEGPAEHFAFLERYGEIDLALDTFPYNGGTTTTEALWQGVPVLCFPGDRWAARISTSLVREAGLEAFVADGPEEYASRAIALANAPETPGLLARLRWEMRTRLGSAPVCDVRSLAREMEGLYRSLRDGPTGEIPAPS